LIKKKTISTFEMIVARRQIIIQAINLRRGDAAESISEYFE